MRPPRSARRPVILATALLLTVVAACGPQPPSSSPVPSIYPQCIGSPACIVENGAQIQAGAISDDGRIMATVRIRTTTLDPFPKFESTIEMVGIEDRWYRKIAVLDDSHIVPWQVVMTPDAEVLAFADNPIPGGPTDPDAGLHVYRRSTGVTARVADAGTWAPVGLSNDGRYLAALDGASSPALVVFDLVAATSSVVAPHVASAAMSGDGRYLVTTGEANETVLHDRVLGTGLPLPSTVGDTPTLSFDGSRVAVASTFGGPPGGFQYLDVGDPAWTQVEPGSANGVTRLSDDGTQLIGSAGGSLTLTDWDLGTGAEHLIAPLSAAIAVSPNGRHVLYVPTASQTTVLRWSR
jgi:hypothetical protein